MAAGDKRVREVARCLLSAAPGVQNADRCTHLAMEMTSSMVPLLLLLLRHLLILRVSARHLSLRSAVMSSSSSAADSPAIADATAATTPADAAPSAASSSAIGVAVQSDGLKACSACLRHWPESDFSGAQLKRKGKRVCKGCVQQWELAAAQELDTPAAAKAAAAVAAAAARRAAPTAGLCVVCGQRESKLRECPKCKGRYCGAVCQLHHRESQQCEEMANGDARQQ